MAPSRLCYFGILLLSMATVLASARNSGSSVETFDFQAARSRHERPDPPDRPDAEQDDDLVMTDFWDMQTSGTPFGNSTQADVRFFCLLP